MLRLRAQLWQYILVTKTNLIISFNLLFPFPLSAPSLKHVCARAQTHTSHRTKGGLADTYESPL